MTLSAWFFRDSPHLCNTGSTLANVCKMHQRKMGHLEMTEPTGYRGNESYMYSEQRGLWPSPDKTSKLCRGSEVYGANETHVLMSLRKPLELSVGGRDMLVSQVVVPKTAFGLPPSTDKVSTSQVTRSADRATESQSPHRDQYSSEELYSGSGELPNPHEAYFLGSQKGTGTTGDTIINMCVQTLQHCLSIKGSHGDTEENEDLFYMVRFGGDSATEFSAKSQEVIGTIEPCDLYKFSSFYQRSAKVNVVGPILIRSSVGGEGQVDTTQRAKSYDSQASNGVRIIEDAEVTWFELKRP